MPIYKKNLYVPRQPKFHINQHTRKINIHIYDVWSSRVKRRPGQSHISFRLLESTSLINRSKPRIIRRGISLTSGRRDSVVQMSQETKGQYVMTYLWHKKPKKISWIQSKIKIARLNDHVLSGEPGFIFITFSLVTRFGNCTNVWLLNQCKVLLFFLFFSFFVYYFFIKNKSMLNMAICLVMLCFTVCWIQ